ncbi:MAG TPA: tripartite tricarboxylate transporter substrate binding protein [Burkholderiales bacterium]|nr:tripartite tricarboxylate transporter substrate binding protein [Burkholderiales bacterium]
MGVTGFREGVRVAGLLIASVAAAAALAAEPWPQRAVRLIVPIGSGSGPDVAARLYAERLAVHWERPVIVENRPGAEGLIGVTAFAGTRDDHALLFSPAAPISVFPYTQDKLAYDPARDFVPISSAIDTFGSIAVPASLKVASLAELVALARAQPGKLNWSSGGGAFPTLLAGFAKSAGLDVVQVSYREQNLAIQDLAEGRIQILVTTLTPLLPSAKAGKIRLLAVTNKGRAPVAPEVPTASEAGHAELEFEGLVGFFGGRDMPAALSDRISADIRAAAADPVLSRRFAAAGQIARGSSPAEFARSIEEQRAKIEAIVRLLGSRP